MMKDNPQREFTCCMCGCTYKGVGVEYRGERRCDMCSIYDVRKKRILKGKKKRV